MKKLKNIPEEKFKLMLKGSATARNLSFIYVLVSLMLTFKLREHIEYVIPLLIGVSLLIWYTLSHLLLKKFNLRNGEFKVKFNLYRLHILKREKYESTVFFIWLLTVVPAYLFEKDITTLTVLKSMVVIYILFILGNKLFNKVKEDLKVIDEQINSPEANNF
ncbi:hypothetical protein [Jejuia spongiicola]|uniref:DUF3278 domain-containing protein n=1 Tax=Jejuia spongiicola TaxID=2942207 RepID=A0ABT0QF94_9FLAO|nr:hypothetical protein [Jejuia spongiicola]MCL6295662.1 hypothetical protein [Jejuia spongiicola]